MIKGVFCNVMKTMLHALLVGSCRLVYEIFALAHICYNGDK